MDFFCFFLRSLSCKGYKKKFESPHLLEDFDLLRSEGVFGKIDSKMNGYPHCLYFLKIHITVPILS